MAVWRGAVPGDAGPIVRRALVVALLLLAGCGRPGQISIPESRLESDPGRYEDWIPRVHLRGDVEFVTADTAGGGTTLRLRRATADHPVVSCAIVSGMAGGFPSSVGVYGGAGGGVGVVVGTGTHGKRIPIHRENQVLIMERFEFLADTLVARIPLPAADGHRYFVRVPDLEELIADPCACIHPGYRQVDVAFTAIIPRELVYRYSGLNPTSIPEGSVAVSGRRTGGLLGSDLGLDVVEEDPLRLVPDEALRLAARGEDDRALEMLRSTITRVSREEFWPHDGLYDHFLAIVLIEVARADFEAAMEAAAHLLHFDGIDLGAVDFDARLEPGSALAEFLSRRGVPLRANWSPFVARLREPGSSDGPD